jgi:hypothetical protein
MGSRGLWLDEFATAVIVRADGLADLVARSHDGRRGPIYYALVALVTRLAGESEASLRAPGVVLGALVPVFVYLGAVRSLGRRAAAAASLLVALHPELVWHAQQARSYVLGELCVAVAFVALGRAVETGRPLARAVLWASGVVAIDAHPTFAPLLGAIALAPLSVRSRERVYPLRAVVTDALVALAALAPSLVHVGGAVRERKIHAWAGAGHASFLEVLLAPEARVMLVFGSVWILAELVEPGGRRDAFRRLGLFGRSRATLAFLVLGVGLTAALALGLALSGSPIRVARYLPVAVVTLPALLGWVIATLPRPLAAVALVVAAGGLAFEEPGNWGQEWREARAQLDALAPTPEEPVLLWTGFIESDVAASEPISVVNHSILTAPIALSPGRPDPGWRVFLLTCRWAIPEQPGYFERELVPLLDRAPRFFVVAHPGYARALEEWFSRRLPGRFRRTFRSREFVGPIVVERFETTGVR